MSGCGFLKQESRRIITDTHWGGEQGPSLAQKSQPAPEAPQAPEADDGTDADQADGADQAEGAEVADTAGEATASTANIGSAGPQTSADKKMTLYVAYQEQVTSKNLLTGDQTGRVMRSRVRICKLEQDNSLQCDESQELNKMLNPHLQHK
jgi:hypothetical protein